MISVAQIAEENRTCQVKQEIDIDGLKSLAIYLEGMYKGQGNLLPLGRIHIDNLWNTINELQRNKK